MKISGFSITAGLMMGLLVTASAMADQHAGQVPYGHRDGAKPSNGIIGISLQVGAERIGDPAVLYVSMVHPGGPAYQAGLRHGDEIVSVDGLPVKGKSYDQVVDMIRGEAGTAVKVGVRGENGIRELSIGRVDADKLKRTVEPHGRPE